MANDERAGRQQPPDERLRQRELDRITAAYADEFAAGRAPRLDDYVRRYPQYAAELADFVLYFHSVSRHLPEPDAVPAPAPSQAASAALRRIREPAAAYGAVAVESLVRLGVARGFAPQRLAAAVGITSGLLGKLEGKTIAAQTIPRTLIERLAATLATAPDALAAYFERAAPAQQPQFYAEQPPALRQETFLEAVEASELDADEKRAWAEIARRDASQP